VTTSGSAWQTSGSERLNANYDYRRHHSSCRGDHFKKRKPPTDAVIPWGFLSLSKGKEV
jgi:hypothetical protein